MGKIHSASSHTAREDHCLQRTLKGSQEVHTAIVGIFCIHTHIAQVWKSSFLLWITQWCSQVHTEAQPMVRRVLTRMPLPVTRVPGTALTSMKTRGTSGNSSLKSFCNFGFRYIHFLHHFAIQSTTTTAEQRAALKQFCRPGQHNKS